MMNDQEWIDRVIEVADHIPDNREVRDKLNAVEQVLKAAIESGWRPPE